jgi:integrase
MNHRSPLTVGEGFELWLQSIRPTVREPTWRDYAEKATRYVTRRLGHVPLIMIQAPQLERLYRRLETQGLSARTVHYVHQILQQMLQHAVLSRLIPFNPARQVRPPVYRRSNPPRLMPHQVGRFLEVARHDEFAALWLLLATTGMRPCEALALTWHHLDVDRALLTIDATMRVLRKGHWFRLPLRCAKQRRRIPVPVTLLSALRAHRCHQECGRSAAGGQWADHDLLFANSTGHPLSWHRVCRAHFQPLLRKAGLPPVPAYSLRHTYVMTLLAIGLDLQTISTRTGYTSLAALVGVHPLPAGSKALRSDS